MAAWIGKFRERGQNGAPDRAKVSDGDDDMWVDRKDYEEHSAYSPPWNDLKWVPEED